MGLAKRNREVNIFSLSALDLFCSAMGAVMILFVVLVPYFGKDVKFPDANVVYVVDTTSSMEYLDEWDFFGKHIDNSVGLLMDMSPKAKAGLVAYRDRGEAYVTRGIPLAVMNRDTPGEYEKLKSVLGGLKSEGGGDVPEAVDEGLRKAMAMFDDSKTAPQIIVLIADAPSHDDAAVQRLVEQWRSGHPNRIVATVHPVESYGGKGSSEAKTFLEKIAEVGGGMYMQDFNDLPLVTQNAVVRASNSAGAAKR